MSNSWNKEFTYLLTYLLTCLEEHADLQTDLADLEAKENQIDDLIRNAKLQIKLLTEDKQYAYVSYQVGLSAHLLSNI
jgi:hypothetical protein